VSFGDELAPGAVRSLSYFGRELVLFRGQDGAAHVLDAHCPHLGAHLGHGGRVEANTIVCPFHAWRWDGSGACRRIPYAKRIPPTARLRAWPVAEHSGVIFVWHDEGGAAPAFELPPHPELGDPDWLPVERHEFTLETCAQEVAENAHDPAHFTAVHGVPALPESRSEFEGPRLHSENRGKLETPRGPVETSSKRYLARPLLCDGDGAIAGFRRWATQFYGAAS
jgi:phenylpropionate dioxygenase-like ring-hydroxylating dioxygenase large terminal subunit